MGPAGCTFSAPQCGDPTTCEPLTSNTGKNPLNFRFRRIILSAPPALATPFPSFIELNVVKPAVDLNAKQCGETGSGTFNWLLTVDKTANTVKTGGAPPTADPFGMGYCYANHPAVTGQDVTSITSPATFTGNTFTTQAGPDVLNVPIFLSGGTADPNNPQTYIDPATGNLTNLVILPLRGGVLKDVTISADSNCIGTLNTTAFTNANCADDPSSCSKWNTAGSLGAYITLADADNVNVSLLNESLCVLLTGTTKNAMGKCAPAALTMGDYCSSPPGPGGCKDSFWLAATFAASAVTVNDGTGNPICAGGGPTDAGGGG